jgi:hypothetical protein
MASPGLPQQRTHDIDQLGRLLEDQGDVDGSEVAALEG